MKTRLFLTFFVFATGALQAQTVILFVGNSFTYGGGTKVRQYNASTVIAEPPGEKPVGGIPAIFKKFAGESGLAYEVHEEVVGGKDLQFHYQNARSLVSQPKWDAVVLQGYSTEPVSAARDGKPDNFVKHAILLEQTVHAAKPGARVYLYETWPYVYKAYPDRLENHIEAFATMAADLRAGYQRAFDEDKHFAKIAPVGDAFLTALDEGLATDEPNAPLKPGQINLWDKDNKHPSVEGSYLSALVLFGTITGSDVTKLGANEVAARDLGITPEMATKLQTVTAATLKENTDRARGSVTH